MKGIGTLTVVYATESDVDRIFEKLPFAELLLPRSAAFEMNLRTRENIAWAEAAIADPIKEGLSDACMLKLSVGTGKSTSQKHWPRWISGRLAKA